MSTASAFLLHERSLSLRFSVVKRVSLRQPPFAVNPLRDRLTRPLSQSETEILHRDWGAVAGFVPPAGARPWDLPEEGDHPFPVPRLILSANQPGSGWGWRWFLTYLLRSKHKYEELALSEDNSLRAPVLLSFLQHSPGELW